MAVKIFSPVPIVPGLIGAVENRGVAKMLRESSKDGAPIRLAYVHNLGAVIGSHKEYDALRAYQTHKGFINPEFRTGK